MPLNFYQILGVPPTVDDAGLKFAFRQFAKQHHPDRPGVGTAGIEMFMIVRNAFEALKDPTVRFAYDRCHSALLICVYPFLNGFPGSDLQYCPGKTALPLVIISVADCFKQQDIMS